MIVFDLKKKIVMLEKRQELYFSRPHRFMMSDVKHFKIQSI